LTADRRGGILIFFGPERCPGWVINPPDLVRARDAREGAPFTLPPNARYHIRASMASRRPVSIRAAGAYFNRNALCPIRASERSGRPRGQPGNESRVSAPRRFAFHSRPVLHLTSSE